MNFQSILNIVLTLLAKKDEFVKIIQEAVALWNRILGVVPQLTGPAQAAGAAAPAMSINWLQESLNKLTDAKLTVDGSYGANTQAAVKKFQTQKGLTADGWAGVETQAAIVAALAAAAK